MPSKDKEKRRIYQREYMKKRRARIKAMELKKRNEEISKELALGNLNYGLDGECLKFPSWLEWKKLNPEGTFKAYLNAKREFEKKPHGVPKLSESEESDFPRGGVNLWDDEKCT